MNVYIFCIELVMGKNIVFVVRNKASHSPRLGTDCCDYEACDECCHVGVVIVWDSMSLVPCFCGATNHTSTAGEGGITVLLWGSCHTNEMPVILKFGHFAAWKIIFTRNMAIFQDYSTYAVSRFNFLVAGYQLMYCRIPCTTTKIVVL